MDGIDSSTVHVTDPALYEQLAEKLAAKGLPTSCPDCGALWVTVSREVAESYQTARDPKDGPAAASGVKFVDPLRLKTVIVSWLVTLECANGHSHDFTQLAGEA